MDLSGKCIGHWLAMIATASYPGFHNTTGGQGKQSCTGLLRSALGKKLLPLGFTLDHTRTSVQLADTKARLKVLYSRSGRHMRVPPAPCSLKLTAASLIQEGLKCASRHSSLLAPTHWLSDEWHGVDCCFAVSMLGNNNWHGHTQRVSGFCLVWCTGIDCIVGSLANTSESCEMCCC